MSTGAGSRGGPADGPDDRRPDRSRRSWRLAAAAALGALLVLFGVGFGAFLLSLDRNEREPATVADGIVALTGGQGRVEDALELLAKGYGGRLLITGVNLRTSRDSIKRLSPSLQHLVECCVDLDYRAQNTVGNAAEIGRWAREKGFRSLIVVTSYYHLPRTLAELEEALPDIRKVPYPVVSSPLSWDRVASRWRVLLSEYVKFLAVTVRTRIAGWPSTNGWTAAARRGGPSVAEKPRAG